MDVGGIGVGRHVGDCEPGKGAGGEGMRQRRAVGLPEGCRLGFF